MLIINTILYITQSNYTTSTMSDTQLGYSRLVTNTTNFSTSAANLLSTTIPKGIWIVEGNVYASISNSTSFQISLSTLSTFNDTSRITINYIATSMSVAIWGAHITSVFVFTTNTTLYLVGKLIGGTNSSSSNYIRYTKIG